MGRKSIPHDQQLDHRLVLKFTKAERDLLDEWLAARPERVLSHVLRPLILAEARKDLKTSARNEDAP